MHMNFMETFGAPNAGAARFALRAWVVAVVPSLLYFFARVVAGADSLRPPGGAIDPVFAAYSILAAPLLETALMYPLASLLALLIPRREGVRIVLSALICALAHWIGGGWSQAISSIWPFLVYSATLVIQLKRSRMDAFVLTALVHALYNATFFAVGALGAFLAAPPA